jgi:hypothetical protein
MDTASGLPFPCQSSAPLCRDLKGGLPRYAILNTPILAQSYKGACALQLARRNPFNEVTLDKSEVLQAVEDALVAAHLSSGGGAAQHRNGTSVEHPGKPRKGQDKAAKAAAGAAATGLTEAAARKQVQRVLRKRLKLLEETR